MTTKGNSNLKKMFWYFCLWGPVGRRLIQPRRKTPPWSSANIILFPFPNLLRGNQILASAQQAVEPVGDVSRGPQRTFDGSLSELDFQNPATGRGAGARSNSRAHTVRTHPRMKQCTGTRTKRCPLRATAVRSHFTHF